MHSVNFITHKIASEITLHEDKKTSHFYISVACIRSKVLNARMYDCSNAIYQSIVDNYALSKPQSISQTLQKKLHFPNFECESEGLFSFQVRQGLGRDIKLLHISTRSNCTNDGLKKQLISFLNHTQRDAPWHYSNHSVKGQVQQFLLKNRPPESLLGPQPQFPHLVFQVFDI